jgi:hypothetical protein
MSAIHPAVYQDGHVYLAKIVDQKVAMSGRGELQVILTILILAQLKNEANAAEGTVPCAQAEREVRITFVADDQQRLRMAVRDLERLGFGDTDISRLDPLHPEYFALVGKDVYVRMRVVKSIEYWNLSWPSERLSGDMLMGAADALKAKIAAAKDKKGGVEKSE